MRTTITLPDDRRKTLSSIAQQRGEKGVNRIVEEAVDFYLRERNKPAPTPVAPPPPPGRWARFGAELDRDLESETGGPLGLMRALVKGGLRRLPMLRSN